MRMGVGEREQIGRGMRCNCQGVLKAHGWRMRVEEIKICRRLPADDASFKSGGEDLVGFLWGRVGY